MIGNLRPPAQRRARNTGPHYGHPRNRRHRDQTDDENARRTDYVSENTTGSQAQQNTNWSASNDGGSIVPQSREMSTQTNAPPQVRSAGTGLHPSSNRNELPSDLRMMDGLAVPGLREQREVFREGHVLRALVVQPQGQPVLPTTTVCSAAQVYNTPPVKKFRFLIILRTFRRAHFSHCLYVSLPSFLAS